MAATPVRRLWVRSSPAVGRAFERAAQIVRDAQKVLGEIRRGIAQRVLAFALGAAAHVLGLGQRAQQPILGIGEFRLDGAQPLGCVFCRRLGLGRLSIRAGAILVVAHEPRSTYPRSRPITLAV